MPGSPIEFADLEALYGHIHRLKKLARQGWLRHGISDPERVSGHSYGVALLVIIFARSFGLDVGRALTIALVHDLAESVVGDITPADNVPPAEKSDREEQAMRLITGGLGSGRELYELWCDFEYARTAEGRLVREIDRLEMAFQALFYEQETQIDLSEFYEYVEERIVDPRLHDVFEGLMARRNSL